MIKIVVIDDEPLARMRIKTLLSQTSVPNQVLAEHGEPVSALMWLREQDAAGKGPDMVLLTSRCPVWMAWCWPHVCVSLSTRLWWCF